MPLVNRYEMLRIQADINATDARLRFIHSIILIGSLLGGLSGAWGGYILFDSTGAVSGAVIGLILGALLSLPALAAWLLYALASIMII